MKKWEKIGTRKVTLDRGMYEWRTRLTIPMAIRSDSNSGKHKRFNRGLEKN